jgi:glutathione S-transferase
MTDLILHHFEISPFGEKIRAILGYKKLAWRSVLVPLVMPKPDVVALTGGYRRTPFLQIGADIYCDTALIARVLEARAPQPTLYPADQPLAVPFAQWADATLFWIASVFAAQPAGAAVLFDNDMAAMKSFGADRAALTAGFGRPSLQDAIALLPAQLAALDAQLSRGGPFLFGAQPSIADFATMHSLWMVRLAKQDGVFAAHAALCAWLDRMAAFGHAARGTREEIDSAQAIAIAAAATPQPVAGVPAGGGFEPGQPVTVAASDYGTEAVVGTLVSLSPHETVIARDDARAGRVQVHFPRQGYQLKKVKTT